MINDQHFDLPLHQHRPRPCLDTEAPCPQGSGESRPGTLAITKKVKWWWVSVLLPFLTLIRVPSWWSHRSLARLCDRGDLWQVPFWIWNTSYMVNYRCRSENWALEQRMQWSYHMILTVYTMINKQYINNLPAHNNPHSRKTQVNHCVNIRKCNHQSKF